MNELIGRLLNLTYDFFGVILPGAIAATFLFTFWYALGDLVPTWTAAAIVAADVFFTDVRNLFRSDGGFWVGAAALGLVSYLTGNVVLWLSRMGDKDQAATKSAWRRVWLSLIFRIPKPVDHYASDLEPLRAAAVKKFSSGAEQLLWRQWFPVMKSYLVQHLRYSLVSTYQNKYTLHRSMVASGALLFWSSIVGLIAALITARYFAVVPRWGLLSALPIFALAIVWGFSGTYMYYWQMFGDTVVTESYSLLFGPKDDQKK